MDDKRRLPGERSLNMPLVKVQLETRIEIFPVTNPLQAYSRAVQYPLSLSLPASQQASLSSLHHFHPAPQLLLLRLLHSTQLLRLASPQLVSRRPPSRLYLGLLWNFRASWLVVHSW